MTVFAPIYELFGLAYRGPFSDDLYTNNIYGPIGTTMIITTAVLITAYYYLISNYGSFYKNKFYFLWTLLIALLNFATAFYLADNLLYQVYSPDEYPGEYLSDIYILSLINFMWSIILSFLLSIVIKFKSIKASRTPF